MIRPGTDPEDRQTGPEDTPPDRAVLKLHSGLQKAESSALVQVRIGRIGLAKLPYSRKVRGICLLSAGVKPEKRRPDTRRSFALKKLSACSASGQTGESITGSLSGQTVRPKS